MPRFGRAARLAFSLMGARPGSLLTKPTASARSPGGSARIAGHGSGAARCLTRLREVRPVSEPACLPTVASYSELLRVDGHRGTVHYDQQVKSRCIFFLGVIFQ